MENFLESFLQKDKLRAKILPFHHIEELENDFNKSISTRTGDKEVFEYYTGWFSFKKPDDLEEANSVIILSAPRPQHCIEFNFRNKAFNVIIPPTYVNYRKTSGDINKLLSRFLKNYGYSISRAQLPLKLLAARCGLIEYGKNNITYAGDWGSFHQLVAFFSDYKTKLDCWQSIKYLEACKSCNLCQENCPTSAIRPDSFTLNAANCLTFFNESENSMPDWIPTESHNSLIGCMKCQLVCPYNNKVKDWTEYIGSFNENETALILGKWHNDKINPPSCNYKVARSIIFNIYVRTKYIEIVIKPCGKN